MYRHVPAMAKPGWCRHYREERLRHMGDLRLDNSNVAQGHDDLPSLHCICVLGHLLQQTCTSAHARPMACFVT